MNKKRYIVGKTVLYPSLFGPLTELIVPSLRLTAEECTVDTDCSATTCHHGAPHCEIHDHLLQHGHCNCHVPGQ